MAATIVSTPATGSSDWTGWISQQGLTDRGFMAVSLTNFATTAASLIGTGSIFELAGSIYSCTETAISLATGTASAAVAVYYVAIPSAGGTVCTFVMDDTAPTWVDAKQGFYASAASTSRYLGGSYIGTAATYYDKWLYGFLGDSTIKIFSGNRAEYTGGIRTIYDKDQPFLIKKVIEIGDWDMVATPSPTVAHGLTRTKIRGMFGIIRDDADANSYIFGVAQAGGAEVNVWIHVIGNTNITVSRRTGSPFDSTDFNSTSYNRGWIIIEYEA